jgi:hypothetical protein
MTASFIGAVDPTASLPDFLEWPTALDDEPQCVIYAALQIIHHPLALNILDSFPDLLLAARAWADELSRPGHRDITHFLMDL